MRSILLLLVLISSISGLKSEKSKQSKDEKKEVKYVGPIVYSNEKPPIIVFPTPESNPEANIGQQNISLKDANIEYVPFPYQDLPVLIYKSHNSPPIHMVSQSLSNDGSKNDSLSSIDKRSGETANTGGQRGGRAMKWSNFKLFNDKPVVTKTQKRGPTDMSGLNLMSTHMIDMNNTSLLNSVNRQLSLAAPHVLYSGHPPIHVFPQPIILKEPEFSEMASASETFHSLKSPNSGNVFDIPNTMSNSNKQEVSTNPASTQFYAYSGTPLGTGNSKSYGFRVKTRGNKQDTDYSSSNNYDNYDDSYSPQHSDGSSDSSQTDDKFRPMTQFSNSVPSESSFERDYDREYDRPYDSYPREKSREKYSKYNSNNWLDWDNADNSWLSSLFGYNRYPSRPRRPLALSLVNSPTNEHLVFAASPGNPFEENFAQLMNPHLRHNGWVTTGMNQLRPTASAIRPVYSFGNLFNYRRPPIPPPPTPYYPRFAGMAPAPNNVPSAAMKPFGLMPPMGLPSVSYPVRIPISPLMMYGSRRPTIGPTGDLAFAESTRNTTNSASKKWANIHDDIQMSGSHFQPTYVLPSAKPTGATAQKKPPLIIYQGLRPPVHVYKQPNQTIGHNSVTQHKLLMSALQKLQDNQEKDQEQTIEETTTTNPYYQFLTTEDSVHSYDNNYKTGSTLYIGENSAFSPRHSSGDWIPVKQHISGSNDTELKL